MNRGATEITLRSMRFHALVGILPHERETPQPIEIDLSVVVSDGDVVVDYGRLYDGVRALVAAGHIDFLEDIAERVAAGAFGASERITRARVAVRKPHVSLGGPLAYAEIRIDRLRSTAGV
jgi:dihydroneopterin aldolase